MKRIVVGAMTWVACGGSEPPPEELVVEADNRVEAAVRAVADARVAMQMVLLVPAYTCADPRGEFVDEAAAQASATLGCASVTTSRPDAATDIVTIVFPGAGCDALGHALGGSVAFRYTGDQTGMALSASLAQLAIDGAMLDATVGYALCGAEVSYWSAAEGAIDADRTFSVDATAARQPGGAPIVGEALVALDGTAEVVGVLGADAIELDAVEWAAGDAWPRAGRIAIQSATGHRIEATFSDATAERGEVEVAIDDYDVVTVQLGT
jgi:hypothetical protein